MSPPLTLPLCVVVALASLVYVTEARSMLLQQYERDREPDTLEDDYELPRRRRVEEEISSPWLGLGLSTGVLSDMQQFFDNLRTNLDSLETLPPEERDALMGKSAPPPGVWGRKRRNRITGISFYTKKDQYFRPAATAAYLHAMRNQRPSYKIRNFVESPEPATLRGTNHYDPSLLWTGLGRRKR
ncbi:uncharacterized protein LOC124354999 isoform X2 [Homalodisca vitripennis]|uniref:uncharacterized protein LOC124354999 isoform X2 n=1 Tax=Homalodisca vitripennis TaxID=197043 RepID=UPI001EECDDCC|nr:uncharacterized protein LOC124354999 isoform X2 [Homalodisca vitripennis]